MTELISISKSSLNRHNSVKLKWTRCGPILGSQLQWSTNHVQLILQSCNLVLSFIIGRVVCWIASGAAKDSVLQIYTSAACLGVLWQVWIWVGPCNVTCSKQVSNVHPSWWWSRKIHSAAKDYDVTNWLGWMVIKALEKWNVNYKAHNLTMDVMILNSIMDL